MLFGTNVGSMWGIQRFGSRSPRRRARRLRLAIIALLPTLSVSLTAAPTAAGELPVYLRDGGEEFHTSRVGTYLRSRELLVYPCYEYTANSDQECKPAELRQGPKRS